MPARKQKGQQRKKSHDQPNGGHVRTACKAAGVFGLSKHPKSESRSSVARKGEVAHTHLARRLLPRAAPRTREAAVTPEKEEKTTKRKKRRRKGRKDHDGDI